MKIRVILHSYLREKLPPERLGRAEMELPPESRVGDLFAQLGISQPVAWSLNGRLERDLSLILKDGDEVRVFRPGAGG
uniref:MoaD/ThiS family protein n=1 Tax=Bellilinea caldifistulae TaxID=360411 RepID=A0A7C4Q960_9CHLR